MNKKIFALFLLASCSLQASEFKINEARLAFRYRLEQNSNGSRAFSAVQDQITLDGTYAFFKNHAGFDAMAQTGNSFSSGWNNTGIGDKDATYLLPLRRLSFFAKPVQAVKISVGSMAPEYGVGSENTYFDVDGYVMGYRANISFGNRYGSKDVLSTTYGFVGDFNKPSIFQRWGRMTNTTYGQLLFTKSFSEEIKATLAYEHVLLVNYARAAAKFDVKKQTEIIDSVTLETMDRIDMNLSSTIHAVRLGKRLDKAVWNKDLQIDTTFISRMKNFNLQVGDKVFSRLSGRLTFTLPELYSSNIVKLGIFLDHVQSFTWTEKFRSELGLSLRF